MEAPIVQIKEILPESGIWNLESLAAYMKMKPGFLQQCLTEKGIKVLILGQRYNMRLISMKAIADFFNKESGK